MKKKEDVVIRVTNWNELGGMDARITLYGRESNSGTYVHLREEIRGGGDYDAWMLTLPSTAAIVNAVSKDMLDECPSAVSGATPRIPPPPDCFAGPKVVSL